MRERRRKFWKGSAVTVVESQSPRLLEAGLTPASVRGVDLPFILFIFHYILLKRSRRPKMESFVVSPAKTY